MAKAIQTLVNHFELSIENGIVGPNGPQIDVRVLEEVAVKLLRVWRLRRTGVSLSLREHLLRGQVVILTKFD